MNELITKPIDVSPDIIDSRYRLVIAAAKRTRQLMEGAKPRTNHQYKKETTNAIQEVLSGKVEIIYGQKALEIEQKRREELREKMRHDERFSFSRGYATESSDVIHAELHTYAEPVAEHAEAEVEIEEEDADNAEG